MKKLVFRLTIAVLAFVLGIGAVALLILNRSLPVIEVQKAKECASESNEKITSRRSALSTELLDTFAEPPLDKTNPAVDESPVVDGAAWILEASKDGRYHFVHRISPSDQMADIFRNLLDLADNRIEYEDYLPQH
ncbi:MAG: hypothetical protein DMF62_11960 [Acidobacteria bacterium]|nr:MAG: hypothetical protein DMF62_11960 [Acidobacteriota bacterium]